MSYKDKFGITDINPQSEKIDCLSVSYDYYDNEEDRHPVFLYTPHMEDLDSGGCPHHYHITLTKERAKVLRDWLNEYLEDVGE